MPIDHNAGPEVMHHSSFSAPSTPIQTQITGHEPELFDDSSQLDNVNLSTEELINSPDYLSPDAFMADLIPNTGSGDQEWWWFLQQTGVAPDSGQ